MAVAATGKVIYEQDSIFIHSHEDRSGDQESLVSGVLRLIEKDCEVIVEYKQLEDSVDSSSMLCAGKDSSSVVQWTQSPKEMSHKNLDNQLSYEAEWDMLNTVSFKKKPSNVDGASNHAHERSKWAFFFNVCDLKAVQVKKEGWSHLTIYLKDDTSLPDLHFHQGGSEAFVDCLKKYVSLNESPEKDVLVANNNSKGLSQSFENLLDDTTFGLIQKFKKDPYTTTMGSFSKVTKYLIDAFQGSDQVHQERPPTEMADLLNEAIPGLEINHQEEPGFEVITRVDLGSRPDVQRKEPVTLEDWNANMDNEGKMQNVNYIKHSIFKGGLCHVARKEAWKFLLGYYPWDSTKEYRKDLQKRKTDEYFRMKLQWKSISEEQEKRNSRLRDYKNLIEKDVNRTDRTNTFYEGTDNPGLLLLHDILMTYCMYDFDLGYVQGMSDLLSPILYVMENEVDAFWCFVSFMDQVHHNFEEQMQGMKSQLVQLSTLLRLLDLNFWNYLESQDSGYLYFCFRWLLILFKREFSFPNTMRLWEVMWTGLPCKNFHLLVCCAILDSEKQKIMDEHYGFNEILKHINELSMKLEVEEVLCKAESIYLQIKNCKDLPYSVSEILDDRNEKLIPTIQIVKNGTLEKGLIRTTAQMDDLSKNSVASGYDEVSRHRETSQNVYKVANV
ncbi:TBC1 domain family member 15 [Polypterus senegalus]|uniref:TBC1 domain family member 15 n=1 Tax=Polypterus senegalus TaxID=55291 RepID=UPI0019649686|nr:TBC1 domain family member 15 [Polypterus senegalus]